MTARSTDQLGRDSQPLTAITFSKSDGNVSPRTTFLESTLKIHEKINQTLDDIKKFALGFGRELDNQLDVLSINNQKLEDNTKLQAEYIKVEKLQKDLQLELQNVSSQLTQLNESQKTSDIQIKKLQTNLESKIKDLNLKDTALENLRNSWSNIDTELQEKEKTITSLNDEKSQKLKENAALSEKAKVLEELNEQQKIEKDQWKAVVTQQSSTIMQQNAAITQKDLTIFTQGQRIGGLEGDIKKCQEDATRVQNEVRGLIEKIPSPLKLKETETRAQQTAKKISPLAIAAIVAISFALIIAFIYWVKPAMLQAPIRGWSPLNLPAPVS